MNLSHYRKSRRIGSSRLKVWLLLSGLLPACPISAATYLDNCFPVKGEVNVTLNYDLTPDDNKAGNKISAATSFVFPAVSHPAQCGSCPSVTASTKEKIYSYRTTPLTGGRIAKYGKLTDNIDIQISAFGDTVAGSTVVTVLDTYPQTAPTTSINEGTNDEATQTLCAVSPVAGTPQREFNWNKITASLYIAAPIFGKEIIPSQLIMTTHVCILSSSTGGCNFSYADTASLMYISGAISAPLSCTINAGSVINVDFNTLANSNFTTKGKPPTGFALRDVDIKFHCDSTAVSNSDKIKLTLTADQGVSDTDGLIAKMIGRDDIGVRMYDSDDHDVPLDGTKDFPIVLDSNGDGHIQMTAAPVATTSSKPAAGKFEGNVTVKMDIK
ncbi:fimbrial protein [Citrobacter farmeri]